MKTVGVTKLIIGILLAVNAMAQIFNHQTWWFIQNVNLVFHEAGHIIFFFFGETLYILGGSLLEVFIPTLITAHFILSRQIFSAACTSWWMATAFLSVAIYAGDAQERLLPLITNDVSTHDWYNLLLKFNLLSYDDWFGYFFILCALSSTVLIIFLLSKDKDVRQLLLE